MDNQDKIFDKFKDAAQSAESKEFPAMEKVWSRVEEKLDKKEDKKTITLWKKVAVAASLLLVISLGYQFLNSDKNKVTETPKVVLEEKDKKEIQQPIVNQDKEIISSDSGIVSKEEVQGIIEHQTKSKERVAIQETIVPNIQMTEDAVPPKISYEVAAAPVQADYLEEDLNAVAKDKSATSYGYSNVAEKESANTAFAKRKAISAKKSAPLIVLNGNAMAHSDDQKRDKMMQAEIPNVAPENVDSLVVLDNPLYIVDGIYYSENDLFGTNPTSPYAPLDKQDIKTLTILQDLEATEKYGEKGKKGVVIITTKTGKPALKK